MNANKNTIRAFAAGLLAVASVCAANAEVSPRRYYGQIARRLCNSLSKMHVDQNKKETRLSQAELSQRAWTNLVTFYDFDHSVFLKSDLEKFASHEKTIASELAKGNVKFGFEVNNLYVKRLRERIEFATNLLSRGEWNFTNSVSYRVKRKDAQWPTTIEEANGHWRKRIMNEVLVQNINRELDAEEAARKPKKDNSAETNSTPDKIESPETILVKKYRQYMHIIEEPDEDTVLQNYLDAFCRSYDPHTDYMAPATKEDFDIDMNLALGGIGAVLSMDDDDGSLKITEIMADSPCSRNGVIKEGDKIIGIQQEGGEMEDIRWKPMKKSVQKIRGKKDTKVTLNIIPKADSKVTKRIELVRDIVKLQEQAATGRVENVSCGNFTNRLGYVFLPGFYGTMGKKPYEEGFRSCSIDVAKYLAEFNEQDVKGLVLDLRGNGGGSLQEAIFLSALFVSYGPVVQVRDNRATGALVIPHDHVVAFRRPMVVLVDRASASASEIVAAHLQDVGRAIVVGDSRTHGKGTVQSVTGLGPETYGSMKITTARFYRIDGRSTQVAGVTSDIHLPSLLDSLDIGEDKLTYSLPFSRIPPADYRMSWNLDNYVKSLSMSSASRLERDQRYAKHLENVRGMKEISDREYVSLDYATRKKMMAADRELKELDDDDDDDDEAAAKKRRRRRNERDKNDIVLDEAFRILNDLVRLTGDEEMPKPVVWW